MAPPATRLVKHACGEQWPRNEQLLTVLLTDNIDIEQKKHVNSGYFRAHQTSFILDNNFKLLRNNTSIK